MKEFTEVKLIDGSFSAQDANDMLITLFRHKIGYHEMQLFGELERFGTDASKSKSRITELKGDLEKVKAFMELAKAEGFEVEIESNISIKVKKGQKQLS